MNRIGMQEAISDKPPIFVPLKSLRIHRTVAEQNFRRNAGSAGLGIAQRKNDKAGDEQKLHHPCGNSKKLFALPANRIRRILSQGG
jgi:hypothetical protein